MYAVIKTGGKQYRVAAGDTLKVESLPADVGAQVKLSEVLAVVDGGDLKAGNSAAFGRGGPGDRAVARPR